MTDITSRAGSTLYRVYPRTTPFSIRRFAYSGVARSRCRDVTGFWRSLAFLCHSSGPVVYLAQVTHLAGKFHLHCCLFALLLPCCTSGTSHTLCREVPSALLPVCSAVSPAYKNFSCSPSFFSSSFLFSFLVFCLVHQSKSQVSSQVRSRLPNQLGSSSALLLPRHILDQ